MSTRTSLDLNEVPHTSIRTVATFCQKPHVGLGMKAEHMRD